MNQVVRALRSTFLGSFWEQFIAWFGVGGCFVLVVLSKILPLSDDRFWLVFISGFLCLLFFTGGCFVYHFYQNVRVDRRTVELYQRIYGEDTVLRGMDDLSRDTRMYHLSDIVWGKKKTIVSLNIYSSDDMVVSFSHLEKIIGVLNDYALSGKRFVVDFVDATQGLLRGYSVDQDSDVYCSFKNHMLIQKVLNDYYNSDVLYHVMVQGELADKNDLGASTIIVDSVDTITDDQDFSGLLEKFKDVFVDYSFNEIIVLSEHSFSVVDSSFDSLDVEDNIVAFTVEDKIEEMITDVESQYGLELLVDHIDLDNDDNVIRSFNVFFEDSKVFYSYPGFLVNFVEGVINLLKDDFGGQWKVSDHLMEDSYLKFKNFSS